MSDMPIQVVGRLQTREAPDLTCRRRRCCRLPTRLPPGRRPSSLQASLPSLPCAQAEDLAVLRRFPPSSLQQLAAQRDVLLAYAAESPAAVAAGFCAAYLLMQVGAGWAACK